jgi:hypothetical protein
MLATVIATGRDTPTPGGKPMLATATAMVEGTLTPGETLDTVTAMAEDIPIPGG